MKIAIVVFLLCAIVTTNAQLNLGLNIGLGRTFTGFPSSQFFLDVILQAEAQKVLNTPGGLPEDLEQRVVDTMSNAELGFSNCNSTTATLPWVQIRCITQQLQISKNELKAIQDEAKARVETPAPAVAAVVATV